MTSPSPADKPRYLRQAIVVDKSLSMPQGKIAAMVAHASMSFIIKKIHPHNVIADPDNNLFEIAALLFSQDRAA